MSESSTHGNRRWWAGIGLVVVSVGVEGAGGWWFGGDGNRVAESESARADVGSSSESGRSNVEHPLKRASEFYDSRPYYQQPFEHTEVPDGLGNLRAETCGSCHKEIYREWKKSTHRRAWTQDPQFMAELKKSRQGGHAGGQQDDVGWMCVTCHTPLVNQMEKLVVGLRDGDIGKPIYVENPEFDEKLQQDAITCAACHVRNGKVYGPYGDTNAPHPTAKDPTLRQADQCTQCHQAEAEWPSRNLACFFNTGKQWESSSYAKNGESCQSCHMPTVERKLAKDFDRPKRKTRRHWFGGSLIPKQPKYAEEVAELQSVYGSGAVLDVHRGGAGSIEELKTSKHGRLVEPECNGGPCRQIVVRATNARAGHWLPTGDPERHIDITAVVRTAEGEVVTRAEQRIASKYEWWPEIEKLYDNRLKPHESVDVVLPVPVGHQPLYVDVVARKYRMYESAFEHHNLAGEYVRGRTFHRSSWRVASEKAPEKVYLRTDRSSEGDVPANAVFRQFSQSAGGKSDTSTHKSGDGAPTEER
jgi:hypothetical protein